MKSLQVLFLIYAGTLAFAQTPVRYDEARKLWFLSTEHTSYVLGVNELNAVQNLYWGGAIPSEADFPPAQTAKAYSFENREGISAEEYPAWGGMRYSEPCLKVTMEDGDRDLVLKYASNIVRGDTLEIRLKDISYDIFVTLMYRVYPRSDIIQKTTRIENRAKQTLVIENAQSGVWYLPEGEGYRLSYLTGYWAGETRLMREPIRPGVKRFESRRGNTSGQFNPWFAIDYQGKADEEHGKVWFGALGWSGNWRIAVEQTPYRQVRVSGGYNDFDFAYPLKPGEMLDTPPFFAGFTDRGFGESSRIMHQFELTSILPSRSASHVRPILYNSWEATAFGVDEPGQKALADKAAAIGVEMFVMDDGWFGERNNDRAGLGDWYVNPKKFPNGLAPLIQHVKSKGLKFGLWVEPEMVNPDSDLYRKHPDWAMHFRNRPRTEGRNQLVLNLARNDVKEHIFETLDKLLTENDLDFLKWDMNRHFTEPGWPEVPPQEEKKLWVAYVTNLYEIIDRLRAKYPKLEIEACSGGGGRVDLGILSRVEQVWTSDNTEAFDRLGIQEGFSYAYAPKTMMAWVTDVPNMNGRSTSLEYRFLVAMMGSLGIGANLHHWTEKEFSVASSMVAYYKQVRKTVQEGKLYRLLSPREGELTANQYVSGDGQQSVLFAFLRSQQYNRPAPIIYLRGLAGNAMYRVRTIDNKLMDKIGVISGAYLMNHGLRFNLTGDFDATSIALDKIK